jgi:thiamine-phosphate pyrophosphorylase
MELGRIILVTDRQQVAGGRDLPPRDLIDVVDAALGGLPPASALVQLREKDLAPRDLYALARRLLEVTHRHRCQLLVNDRIDVALAAGADGVHLPEKGLPIAVARRLGRPGSFIVGVSVHGADAAGAAARDGADLVVCGPVWSTPSKRELGEPLGEAALTQARKALSGAGAATRLYAIGGVTEPERAHAAVRAGAHGIAVVRGIVAAEDPAAAARALYDAVLDSRP